MRIFTISAHNKKTVKHIISKWEKLVQKNVKNRNDPLEIVQAGNESPNPGEKTR